MPFVQNGDVRIHYLDEGSGPPLVWLPGGNDHAGLMLYAHRRLLDRYRLICIDPRGQGRSDAPTDTWAYEPAKYVSDVIAVLDALGLERPVIGGHSRGGRTTMELAISHPTRPRAAIAASSPHLGGVSPDRQERFEHYRRVLTEAGVDGFLPLLAGAPRHPERRAEYEQHIRNAGPEALIAQYGALARMQPLPPRMGAITAPTLFLCGDQDQLLPHSEAAAAATPGARLAIVPGAGHAIFAGSPDAYFAPLAAFLAEAYRGELVEGG